MCVKLSATWGREDEVQGNNCCCTILLLDNSVGDWPTRDLGVRAVELGSSPAELESCRNDRDSLS